MDGQEIANVEKISMYKYSNDTPEIEIMVKNESAEDDMKAYTTIMASEDGGIKKLDHPSPVLASEIRNIICKR